MVAYGCPHACFLACYAAGSDLELDGAGPAGSRRIVAGGVLGAVVDADAADAAVGMAAGSCCTLELGTGLAEDHDVAVAADAAMVGLGMAAEEEYSHQVGLGTDFDVENDVAWALVPWIPRTEFQLDTFHDLSRCAELAHARTS